MDLLSSSPLLPRAGLFGSEPSNDSMIDTSAKKQKTVDIDDSSSIASTSMSSTREKACHVCKEPESLPTKPLFACVRCRGKWHQFCHNPKIFDFNEWRCARCMKKMNAKIDPPAKMDPPAKVLTAVSVCEFPNCGAPIFQGNSSHLCKKHKIQAQWKNANKQKSSNTSKAAPASKPFNLAKLHRVNNPDEDLKAMLKKDKKRKREASSSRRVTSNHTSEISSSEPRKIAQPQYLSRSSSFSNAPSKPTLKPVPHSTPEERQYIFNLAAQNKKNAAASALSETIPETTTLSNSEFGPRKDTVVVARSSNPAQQSPRNEESTTSHEYDPPPANETTRLIDKGHPFANPPKLGPPPPIEISKLTIADTDEESPGSQIVQEFQATVENPLASPAVPADSFINRLSSFRAQDPQEQELMDIAVQKELEGSEEVAREDEVMLDSSHFSPGPEPEPVPAEDIPLPSNERGIIPASPSLTSISSSTTPDDDILLNEVIAKFAVSPPSESIEAKRKQKAAQYNSSNLDSFLIEQSKPVVTLQPTPEELARTQIWGHIDPRAKWPKEHSDEWLAEKRQEIRERGRRKANFGKLLTSQVVKERSENGWGPHQSKEVTVDEEKLAEGARALEELFGIKGIDELEPVVRNERFGMSEKSRDENGRAKRKPKMYPVGY